jgi:pantoate--beta-alanine ligase
MMVKVIHTIREFREYHCTHGSAHVRAFAPTMGALHDGHASLIRQARTMAGANGLVLSSIFVNPTQFGPQEDFAKYPRTLESDVAILTAAGCDAVFVPSAEEMYPGIRTLNTQHSAMGTSVDPGPLANALEGAIRPGHFRGVCTVVAKLLNITQPTHLLLGQKDFQQQAILRLMVRELDMPCEVVTCPTLRESDGLAMSSRNRYLSTDERSRAPAIFQAMSTAKAMFDAGERQAATLNNHMQQRITAAGMHVQYALVADRDTLSPFQHRIDQPAVLLVAAKLGTTRLIDNLLL